MSKSVNRWMFLALLWVPSVAAAQEPGSVGIVMGYPNLGLIWQVSEKVAIRPEISFSWGSTDIDSTFGGGGTSTNWSVGFGASALLYLSNADRLRTYVAPQFTYDRSEAESGLSAIRAVGNTYAFAGLFGAQYSLSDRFSIFGELGLRYLHSTTESVLSELTTKRDSWGTRTGVGAILYF